MTAAPSNLCYRFGRFELQPNQRRLLASGTPVDVGSRAFDLLVMLVERDGHLVTKDELLERVWPKVIVEENTLQAQVSALRKILGREAIATISGRGYRFALELTYAGAESVVPKHNVPQQLTSFIGREKEIAQIKELLGTTRLLTLIGAGGCGKTRLAMQVAGDLVQAYSDGIWLVELAALAEPGLVPQTVANVLGLKEQPGESLTQTFTKHLASRHLLLVLDNAEHLLAACAEFADVALRQCAQLIILITSRERLGIAGELTYRVPSLSVPDPKRDATPEELSSYESARLFIERARLQQPHFAVTTQNAPALASVCHRLDGIPLAIELAAPRVRSMSVEEVNRRLDQRFGLLTGGSRTALPRQRTLRAMIDWSYDLLSDAEQALLCRLSVFSGGWTLDAAENVCIGDGIADAEVLDLLTSLADKSLISAEADDGETRYWLLETVRHYAQDRLRERDEEEAQWQRRHLGYFVALAEEAEPLVMGADEHVWLERLETEHENLRSALAWSSTSDEDAEVGLRLAAALYRFWWLRGYRGEGRAWLVALLNSAPGGQSGLVRAKALCAAGSLAYLQGDYPAARAFHEQSLAMGRELGDRPGIAKSLHGLAALLAEQGDFLGARALYEQSLVIHRELGDRRAIAASLSNLGIVASDQGDFLAARALNEESHAIRRELGDRWGIACSLNNLAVVARRQGDYSAARALCEESVAICRELGERQGIAAGLGQLGLMACDQGDCPSARAPLKESLAIFLELGDQRGIAEALERLAYAFSLDRSAGAALLWGAAKRLREAIGAPQEPNDRPRAERQVLAARAALGDDTAFDLAWQEGRAMNLERIVRYALDPESPNEMHLADIVTVPANKR
jgi:predicted ATPase/DNA-binding winged helix-turn-helix (wHTH) protein